MINELILKYKTQKFNLLNYRKNVNSIRDNAGLIVISPTEIYKLDVPEFKTHQDMIKKILKAENCDTLMLRLHIDWAATISKHYKLIIIRIIRDMDIIYLPHTINDYQLEHLINYNEELKSIDKLLNVKRDVEISNTYDNYDNLDELINVQKVKKKLI